MAEGLRVGNVAEIPVGEGRMFEVGGRVVAVFRTHADEIYATEPYCPHRGGPLADGLIGGTTVVCPLHDRIFDLTTGCGLSHEMPTIATYPVKVEAGEIWIAWDAVPS